MKARIHWIAPLLLLPAYARAHAMLDHARPAVGSTVPPPTELRLWFDQPVDAGRSDVAVTDTAGKLIAAGPLRGDAKDDTLLILPLAAGVGKVTVKWSAFSPPCGHTTHGTFTFTIVEK